MSEIQHALSTFLNSKQRNAWLMLDGFKIYVRRSHRFGCPALDLATIEVYQPGHGTFTRILPKIIDTARASDVANIYVENVMDARFADFFRRRGWSLCPGCSAQCPCFYLPIAQALSKPD